MLVREGPDQIDPGRAELDTLVERRLVAMERLESGLSNLISPTTATHTQGGSARGRRMRPSRPLVRSETPGVILRLARGEVAGAGMRSVASRSDRPRRLRGTADHVSVAVRAPEGRCEPRSIDSTSRSRASRAVRRRRRLFLRRIKLPGVPLRPRYAPSKFPPRKRPVSTDFSTWRRRFSKGSKR